MNDKAEELIRQILEKTERGKLLWHFVSLAPPGDPWTEADNYRADLEDGSSFTIRRLTSGDNKILDFELSQNGRVILSEQADNFLFGTIFQGPEMRKLLEIRRSHISDYKENLAESADEPKVVRFRLFSDLFYAARESAVAKDQTIEKVQQLLERLG